MIDPTHWQSLASLQALQARANLNRRIRDFFYQRDVMEVETPALSRFANPDPQIHSLKVESPLPGSVSGDPPWYLHTSPEFAMKRLLAGGSGAIYQLCKVFRGHEAGRLHNPEFTLLEWYRPGFTLRQLMEEVDALIHELLPNLVAAEFISYGDLFQAHFSQDPYQANASQLQDIAQQQGLSVHGMDQADRNAWLDLLFSHYLQPKLGHGHCTFVYDFPASQCALARINPGPVASAARFELFVNGVELANGYDELIDAEEMRRRFDNDIATRMQRQSEINPYDEWALQALAAGMPASCGVALGVDRLLLLLLNSDNLDQIMSFSQHRS